MTAKPHYRKHREGLTVRASVCSTSSTCSQDEASATVWLENIRWPTGVNSCPRCGTMDQVASVAVGKAHALPLRCLPQVLLGSYRHGHGIIPPAAP